MSDVKTPEVVRSDSTTKLKIMINPAIKLASDRITFDVYVDGVDEAQSDRLLPFIRADRKRSDDVDDEYSSQFDFTERIPLSILFKNRLFDLDSFLQGQDPGLETDEWFDYLVSALNQVLQTGTLTIELDNDGSESKIDNPHNMVVAIYQLGDFEINLNLGRLTEDRIKHFFLDAEAGQATDET